MDVKIFYSWQSDLPNNTNRGFIFDALGSAVKEIQKDQTVLVEPRVDRDTAGIPGSPSIPEAILAKIDSCSIFVADVSIINLGSKFRMTPNPNVLFELGYALKTLKGWDRIVMVCNESYGKISKLPFDLPERRVVPYSLKSDDADKSSERRSLTSKFKAQLQLILNQVSAEIAVSRPSTVPESVTRDKVLHKATLIAAEKRYEADRKNWSSSNKAFEDILGSVNDVFALVRQRFATNKEVFEALGVSLLQDKMLLVLSTDKYGSQINFEGINENHITQTIFANIQLLQILFTKQYRSNTVGAVKKARLTPDLAKDGSIVWKESESKILTTNEVADRCFDWLLDQIENPKVSVEQQARQLGKALGTGPRFRKR